jgi:squalene-associated FAD-dependent desaturase
MGCYTHTIRFLKKTGSLQKLKFQKDLSVNFADTHGKTYALNCFALPAPFHLVSGLLMLGSLSWFDKWAMLKVYRALRKHDNGSLRNQTVEDWLKSLGQSKKSRKYFWDLITIATLNEQSSIAEADALAIVLKEAFFSSKENSQIAVSSVGLSELCGPGAEQFLKARHGEIKKNQLVSKIVIQNNKVEKIVLRDQTALTADYYVSAVPFFILKNILDKNLMEMPFFAPIRHLETAPILSISLWFDRAVTDKEFVGLLDTEVQWVFNKSQILSLSGQEGYLSLVISGAHAYMEKSNEKILNVCLKELGHCFPKSQNAKLLHWLIQRERHATLSPKIGYDQYRLPQKTPIGNFFLCGDWTQTGFPATIESAVLSGVKASEMIS